MNHLTHRNLTSSVSLISIGVATKELRRVLASIIYADRDIVVNGKKTTSFGVKDDGSLFVETTRSDGHTINISIIDNSPKKPKSIHRSKLNNINPNTSALVTVGADFSTGIDQTVTSTTMTLKPGTGITEKSFVEFWQDHDSGAAYRDYLYSHVYCSTPLAFSRMR